MGMVVDGQWTDRDTVMRDGRFVREQSALGGPIAADVVAAAQSQPGRFLLIASASCPWSHRAMLVHALRGLGDRIPVHLAHGPRREGYAVDGGRPWPLPGAGRTVRHLHEVYTAGDPDYTGRATVPVLWDGAAQSVVGNDSAAIARFLDALPCGGGRPRFTLRPDDAAAGIDAVNDRVYRHLSNGVYRAGFAETQDAYDDAVADVFDTLDWLEDRLSGRRYLMGPVITEADWFLFPTLVRFDAVYAVLHRCCRRRLVDYPALWAYARDLFGWRGVAATIDFEALRVASYRNDTAHNPHGIVAVRPDADWHAPHGREVHGPAHVAMPDGGSAIVEPEAFGVAVT